MTDEMVKCLGHCDGCEGGAMTLRLAGSLTRYLPLENGGGVVSVTW